MQLLGKVDSRNSGVVKFKENLEIHENLTDD